MAVPSFTLGCAKTEDYSKTKVIPYPTDPRKERERERERTMPQAQSCITIWVLYQIS